MKYFRELNIDILKDKNVILDIDGTITYDKHSFILEPELEKIIEIKKIAKRLILISNGDPVRTDSFGILHELEFHISEYKKPNKKVLEKLLENEDREYVVIGDKFVTDGILALRTKNKFIHVRSLKNTDENIVNKFIYLVDDILGYTFELFRLMRPQQWIKNFLVFTPAFFAASIFDYTIFVNSLFAFLIFSLTASFVYVINDIKDKDLDILHHKKKWRPIPSQNISSSLATIFAAVILSLIVLLLSKLIILLPIIIIYIFSNLLYTFKFKNIPVFDIVLVASMYVLRVVAGGVATGLFVSPWIIACTFFAALFLITCKRYVEFQNPVRAVLKRYTKESLTALLIISANLSCMSYVLYTIENTRIPNIFYTSPFVIAVFLIILNDIFNGEKKLEQPEMYLVKNKHILFVIFLWLVCIYYLVYTV